MSLEKVTGQRKGKRCYGNPGKTGGFTYAQKGKLNEMDGCDDSWWWYGDATWQDAGWGLTAVPQYKHEVQTRRWHCVHLSTAICRQFERNPKVST